MYNFIVLICTLLIVGKTGKSIPHPANQETDGCTLPPYPDNGRWILKNGEGEPGDTVPQNSILEFQCNKEYFVSKSPYVVCVNGWSEKKMPSCKTKCPPLYSSSTTTFICTDKVGQPIDCTQASEGSILECAPYYEVPLIQNKVIICQDGVWSYPKPQCQPVCGKKKQTQPQVNEIRSSDKLKFPWVVAIYIKAKNGLINICGGTIITKNIVLTAAHCVTDIYGEPLCTDLFRVAAAKLYNKYGDPQDTSAQFVEVSNIIVHSEYKGESKRYLGDISLLITKTAFILGNLIQPACISGLGTIHLSPGIIGETAAWGVTENGAPAEELRSIEIPFKSAKSCSSDMPQLLPEIYHLIDKMCAGSPKTNISICEEDSGNGLFFKNPEDGRYYIHGVLSSAPFPSNSRCNTLNSALYTKVSLYISFIEEELSKMNKCKLPPFPENGNWTLESDHSKVPGDIVPLREVLTYKCDPGYKLTTFHSSLDCEKAIFLTPFCQPKDTFSSLETSSRAPLTTVTPVLGIDNFFDTDDKSSTFSSLETSSLSPSTPDLLILGIEPVDSSSAFSTPETSSLSPATPDSPTLGIVSDDTPSTLSSLETTSASPTTPIIDEWLDTLDCGIENNETATTLPDNTTLLHSKYPWQANLYIKRRFIGVGTLISQRVILTTAYLACKQGTTTPLDPHTVKVVLGKFYKSYGDPRDEDAKYYEVSDVVVFEDYDGIKQGIYGDIGFFVSKTPVEFNQWIKPVCIKGIDKLQLKQGDVGVIYGFSNKVDTELVQLMSLEVTYNIPKICFRETPHWLSYLSEDLICGKASNKTAYNGDGGTGWWFKNPEDGRYYIHGILGLIYVKNQILVPGENNVYVNLKFHYDYIIEIIKRFG